MLFRNRKHPFGRRPSGDAPLQGLVLSPSFTLRQLTSLLLGMVFTASLIILLGSGSPPLAYRRGQVAPSDIRARVSFSIVDDKRSRDAEEDAALKAPSVYDLDRSPFNRALDNLKNALAEISRAQKYEDIAPAAAQSLGITPALHEKLKETSADWTQDSAASAAQAAFDAIVKLGCISDSDAKLEQTRSKAEEITISDGLQKRGAPIGTLVRPDDLKGTFARELSRKIPNAEVAAALTAYLDPSLKPFLSYNEAKSAAAKKEAMDATAEVKQFYDRGDVLVRRDSLMDNLQITLLEKEQEVYRATMRPRDRMVRLVGMAITVSFLVWLFGSYVSQYEPRVLTRRIRIIILMALAVVLVAITRFFVQSPLSLHLIPMALFAMAVAVAYNPLFAVGYTLFLAILVGITAGGDFALSISLFLGSIMGVMTIGSVRSRTTAFWAGLAAGIGTFIATWGTGLLFHADYDYKVTLSDSGFGLVNGLFCGAVITVLLPFIENTFGIITQLSLFELVDLNKPVLRRLALEAPGSYNHSLMVGNLADSAAEVIGASRLLARAGGYYHDIGKLSKPDYFVENRGTAASRHYNLSPTMSTLIIISHVKDAVEIAREYKLPSPVVDIIREHHGTTLVEYFYREAIEQSGDAAAVSDQSFRYPGPRPQSKEAAIVMLADSVESASRTITEPTPSKLESLVADIAKGKLEDGQFDECNLTMAELRQIEVSLTKSLAGIFHSRIKYPGREL